MQRLTDITTLGNNVAIPLLASYSRQTPVHRSREACTGKFLGVLTKMAKTAVIQMAISSRMNK